MNDRVLDMFPGDTVTCFSVDSVAEVDQQAVYPTEYLNSLTLSGLPPHKLNIKVGAPAMLLRNIDPARGHCNGTRYIVRQISQWYITGQIACGEYSGNVLLIPRILLSPTDAGLPFTASTAVSFTTSICYDDQQGPRPDTAVCRSSP